jgi:hypothetical protein
MEDKDLDRGVSFPLLVSSGYVTIIQMLLDNTLVSYPPGLPELYLKTLLTGTNLLINEYIII